MSKETKTHQSCHYCGDPCLDQAVLINDLSYCCYGCATLDNVVSKINTCPEHVQIQYKQFDLADNFNRLVSFQNDKIYKVGISLPAIHCSSCVELLEDLPSFHDEIVMANVNFEQRRCTIIAKKSLPLSFVAQLLDDLGYPPQISVSQKEKELEKRRRRSSFFKMVVAGFCFGNIMLYSMPHYFGLRLASDPFFSKLFVILSLAMSIPVLFYSGLEYLKSAYKALAASRTHINIPIAIGMISLWAWSLYEIVSGKGPGYLDSLAGLVFFLLVGKWFQSKIYDQVSFKRELSEFIPMVVRKGTVNGFEWSPIHELQGGEEIIVKNNEVIPVDGILATEHASIDYSFITGEQLPEEVLGGAQVYTGGRQLGGELRLIIDQKPDVQQLWSNWNLLSERAHPQTWTNRISKYFTLMVLAIAAGAGVVWWFIDPSKIPFVVSAVLIVACPCALALSAPFTYGNVLRIFSKNQFYIKDPESIQNLSKVEQLVFDKTGTLTKSQAGSVTYNGKELDTELRQMIYSACSQSVHPMSQMIAEATKGETVKLEYFEEVLGKGLVAHFNQRYLRIGSMVWLGVTSESKRSVVGLELDGKFIGQFNVQAEYRAHVNEVITTLGSGYSLSVLSGDNDKERNSLLQIYPHFDSLLFNLKPQDKMKVISKLRDKGTVAMIGDGLNDSAALSSSDFGIAVTDSLNGFYPGADAVMISTQFRVFPKFMKLANYAPTVLKVGLIFSLLYNLIGVAFAVGGLLTPIVAAILMPISSVTVVSLDTLLVRLKAKKLKLI